jgi:peptidoglycan/xylan/chitin deacetylase (PgdA/CDA1 family)
LRTLGQHPRYRLGSVEAVRALGRLPNVAIGNHTNAHFKPLALDPEQTRLEYERSIADFDRIFGPTIHLAFPFGTPSVEIDEAHVEIVRRLGVPRMWSTERRPYKACECQPGAVLPRFPVDGRWDPRQTATLIALRSLAYRILGPQLRGPNPPPALQERC